MSAYGGMLIGAALGLAFLGDPWVPAGMVRRTTGRGVSKCRARRKVRNRIAAKSRARNRK